MEFVKHAYKYGKHICWKFVSFSLFLCRSSDVVIWVLMVWSVVFIYGTLGACSYWLEPYMHLVLWEEPCFGPRSRAP